jgi:hypothetical protein
MSYSEYLQRRIRPRIQWYDKRAVASKRAYLAIDLGSTILSIMLVVLLHVDEIPRLFLSALAASVALLMAIERALRFRERWTSYRLTAEAVDREVKLYEHSAGAYRINRDESFALLVERVENLLQDEAGKWLGLVGSEPPSLAKKIDIRASSLNARDVSMQDTARAPEHLDQRPRRLKSP